MTDLLQRIETAELKPDWEWITRPVSGVDALCDVTTGHSVLLWKWITEQKTKEEFLLFLREDMHVFVTVSEWVG